MKLSSLLACFSVLILSPVLSAQSDPLLDRVWDSIQQTQKTFANACGSLTETRTSKLMSKPMVLHGKFCAEGMNRFSLEYSAPNAMRIRFNTDYLNVTTSDGKTEILDIGSGVRHVQSEFSRESSLPGLKKNFAIEVHETAREYELKLSPRSDIFRKRINLLVVRFSKRNFLPDYLQVEGRNGVSSVFEMDYTSFNTHLPEAEFEVRKKR